MDPSLNNRILRADGSTRLPGPVCMRAPWRVVRSRPWNGGGNDGRQA